MIIYRILWARFGNHEIKEKTEKRDKQHAAYEVKAKDMSEAIDACAAAIQALEDSKSQLKGAKVDFVQVTSGLAKAVSKQPLLAQIYSKAAPKFEYQSNDIIATLDDLLATFKSMKKDPSACTTSRRRHPPAQPDIS